MATGSDLAGGLIAKVRRFREIDNIQDDSVANVAEILERISTFLQERETQSQQECTHAVFDNYPDWWQGQRSYFKLAIAEDNTLELLYEYIGTCYRLGIPLTLTEKRTAQSRLVHDIEIWGAKGADQLGVTAQDLLGTQSKFARLVGEAMGEVYPQNAFLDCAVFDSSGISRTRNVMKMSLRLVWPSIVVDRERSKKIRDYIVQKLRDSQDEELVALEQRLRDEDANNQWNSIFSTSVYEGRDGVRMPLNDRTSPAPLKKPERRPFAPFGVVRFDYNGGKLENVSVIAQEQDLDPIDWVKIGVIRKDAGEPLTEWNQPVVRGGGSQPRGDRPQGGGGAMGGGGGGGGGGGYSGNTSRAPGQVRISTRSGSGSGNTGPRQPRRTGDRVESEAPTTVEREFDGDMAQFRERLEQQLGRQDGTIEERDGTLTWTQPGGEGSTIQYRSSNHRVYIRAKTHQLRSLTSVVSSFVRPVSDDGRSVVSSRAQTANRAGSVAAASAVYAPSASRAPSAAYAASSTSVGGAGRSVESAAVGPTRRMAVRRFEPQGNGELSLTENEFVIVTHDPEVGQGNIHRWVYGRSERTQESGWFPLSHTAATEAPAPEES
mmetsp:Transcript_133229/g.385548  ORF Transcript_133229/g.385548 Transcript_133229/m.385548 type:complete len:604 (+) Transcript_133229:66-1877(+)